jgi:iron complex outermembrane receptor protein
LSPWVSTLLVAVVAATGRAQDAPGISQPAADPSAAGSPAPPPSLDKLLDMAEKDMGQLSQVQVRGTGSPSLDMPVSSVSRQESTVGQSPAAVFVITNEMIRRSGARTIPEVLRMAPGVEVAQIDSNKWSVSIRGFSGRFTYDLLVMVDGRIVYDPLFNGVFWDVQDVLLEDVERIEVVRGPGDTIWGTNAVGGVINIITKSAKDTQGVYFEGGAGTHEQGFTSARYGGKIGDDLSYRVYGKWFDVNDYYSPDFPATDAWQQVHGGLRVDWRASERDSITFQGDYYNGYDGDEAKFPSFITPDFTVLEHDSVHVSGDDVLLNWRRTLGDRSDWTAKVYYDQTQREWPTYGFGEEQNTFDFDFQYRFPLGERNEMICGTEYRNVMDNTQGNDTIAMVPAETTINYYSCFVQDQFTVKEDLCFLTVGSKFERDDFTGFEWEPSIRLLLTPSKQYSVWGAVSRAVRMPCIGEEDAQILSLPIYPKLPVFPLILGNHDMLSEESIAYEAGVRGQTTDKLSWDMAVFLNDYDRLTGLLPDGKETGPGGVIIIPMLTSNVARGDTYGFELGSNYKVAEAWQVRAAYSFLVMDLQALPGSVDPRELEGGSPRNQLYLHSTFDLGRHWELDLIGRYVDTLPVYGVSKYIVGDVRLAWRPNKNLELSVVGRNLGNGKFYEFGNDQILGALATEVVPEVYGQVVWRY